MKQAVGLIEVYGLAAAFAAADAACKAANITIDSFDKNKPANADSLKVPLIIIIKIRGTVSDVKMAIEAGVKVANKVSGTVVSHVIANPTEETEKIISLNFLK